MPFQAVLWGGDVCVYKKLLSTPTKFEAASRHYPVTSDACAARHEDVETLARSGLSGQSPMFSTHLGDSQMWVFISLVKN